MSLLITATDTDVGKTLITGGLAYAMRRRGLDVGCWKPMQSGHLLHEEQGDVCRLKAIGNLPDTLEQIGGFTFAEPLAPRLSAERAGVHLTRQDLLTHYEQARALHEHLLIEGAGGLAVPLTADTTVCQLAQTLQLPLLIVARANLGTVNHTTLTVHYAQAHGLHVAGVVLSGRGRNGADVAEQHNAAYIEEYAGVPVLGSVPWLGDAPDAATIRQAVEEEVAIDRLIERLTVRLA
ncbi:MAG: dethiobiotin synthase [Tumebacillaceae bacterium]